MAFGTIEQAIGAIRDGKFVIVADDEDRENEGDLICAAQLVTPAMINFMNKRGSGMICLALTGDRIDALGLTPIAETNLDGYRTAVHRQHRRRAALWRDDRHQRAGSRDDDSRRRRSVGRSVRPAHGGHVFPLRAREGGVLQRVGHTESRRRSGALAGALPGGRDLRDLE
jgi:3,4-dihydroxy 2-butanone 4-phosphate synthase/GTP cyclohydrolase II